MAIENINVGALPNDGSGDAVRVAFGKVNNNFTEVGTLIDAAEAAAIPATEKGAASGVATLDVNGLVAERPATHDIPGTGRRNGQYYSVGEDWLNVTVLGDFVHFLPFVVSRTHRVAKLAVRVTGAATAASPVGRVGLYADNGAGAPGALEVDAGGFDPALVGIQEVTLVPAVTLTPGVYWTAVAYSGGAGRPMMRGAKPSAMLANDSTDVATATEGAGGVIRTGYAGGALPNPADSSIGSRTNVPTLAFQVLNP